MNWTIIASISAASVPIGSFMIWIMRAVIQGENAKLLVSINGTYVRALHSTLTGAEIERSLNQLREDVDEIKEMRALQMRPLDHSKVSVYS